MSKEVARLILILLKHSISQNIRGVLSDCGLGPLSCHIVPTQCLGLHSLPQTQGRRGIERERALRLPDSEQGKGLGDCSLTQLMS